MVVVVLLLLVAVSAIEATVVSVEPATQNVSAGQAFTIDISVDNVTEMTTDGAYLRFDSAAVRATGVTEGLTSGNPHVVTIETIDNTNGEVVFTYSISNNVSGSGPLVTIQFKANQNAEGVYNLNLTDVELYNETDLIPLEGISNGTVTILAAEAVNVPQFSPVGLIALVGLLTLVLALSIRTTKKRGN